LKARGRWVARRVSGCRQKAGVGEGRLIETGARQWRGGAWVNGAPGARALDAPAAPPALRP
jgi:hypothetical protein